MRGKRRCEDSRESSRFKHRTFTISRSIRYLSRYPPPFSRRLLSFSRFPHANVSIFSLSWHNTLDNTLVRSIDGKSPVHKYGNRTEKRTPPHSPRIILMRPRLRQFSTEFSNRFEFPRRKFPPIFTSEKNTLEKSVKSMKSVSEVIKVLRVK